MLGKDSQDFIEKENNKVQKAKEQRDNNLMGNATVNKEGFIPSTITSKEEYYSQNKVFEGTGVDRDNINYVNVKDKTVYEDYDDDNFALILELANFLPVDDIARVTDTDIDVVVRVIKRANKNPLNHYDKPPIVIWLPRFMWRFVDLVNLQYNPKWVEEAKMVFFKTLKKIRSKSFRV